MGTYFTPHPVRTANRFVALKSEYLVRYFVKWIVFGEQNRMKATWSLRKTAFRFTLLWLLLWVSFPERVNAEETTAGQPTTLRGVVMPISQSKLGFEQSGTIIFLPLEGARVKKGDVIARIQDTVLREKQTKSKALLAAAQLALDQAIHERDKAGRLLKQKIVSKMGTKEAQFAVTQARIGLDQSKSDLRAAQKAVRDCEMKAPFDGVVVSVSANLGEYIIFGTEVLQLVDLSKLELSIDMQPAEVKNLRVGQMYGMLVDGQQVGSARIRTALPLVDGGSGLQRVIWSILTKNIHIVTGRYVRLQQK